jgi:hypothetical protein
MMIELAHRIQLQLLWAILDTVGPKMRVSDMAKRTRHRMDRPLPRSLQAWLEEIVEAIADAAGTKPFGQIIGTPITDADLFHLAPLVCLKFRGREI